MKEFRTPEELQKQQARRDFIDKAAIEAMSALLVLCPSTENIYAKKLCEDAYKLALAMWEEKERVNT